MEIRHELKYDAPVDEVYAMLGDRDFREKVCRALGTATYDVTVDPTEDGMTVRIDMLQEMTGMPGFARRIVGDTTRVIQTERWVAGQGADLQVEIPGKPGHIRGNITLLGEGTATLETFAGEARISIPLVGGRLEGLIERLFREGMDTEQRVGAAWLAGER